MADRFEQALRAGSARFAMNTDIERPHDVRARGERRRRRRIAVVASAVVLAVAGLGGTAYAAGWGPSSAPPAGTTRSPATSHSPSPSRSAAPSHRADGGMSQQPGSPDPTGSASSTRQCSLGDLRDPKVVDGGVGGGHSLNVVRLGYTGAQPCTLTGYPTLTYLCGGNEQTGEKHCVLPARRGTWFDGGPNKEYGGTVQPGGAVYFDLATVSEPTAGEKQTYSAMRVVIDRDTQPLIDGGPFESTGGVSVSQWYVQAG